jgi:threonine aldolase
MNEIVDLRSDTVTRPTPEMYEAMRTAELGDDVLGDDPTVAKLERLAADMLGKEAAMYVPSGTMSNQAALATHCRPGDSALFEEEAHMLFYECGAPAVIAQVVTRTVPSVHGVMQPEEVEARILHKSLHTPGTKVICVENTHNRKGGAVTPVETMAAYAEIAQRHEIKVHLDGARLFNASTALGVEAKQIAGHVDTVSICLSKGLRSPVGSVLCGPAEFIDEARYWRKRLGGGMRQAGILAACGIVSLSREDTVAPAEEWVARLREHGVWVLPMRANRFRVVMHADVDDAKLDRAISVFRRLAA